MYSRAHTYNAVRSCLLHYTRIVSTVVNTYHSIIIIIIAFFPRLCVVRRWVGGWRDLCTISFHIRTRKYTRGALTPSVPQSAGSKAYNIRLPLHAIVYPHPNNTHRDCSTIKQHAYIDIVQNVSSEISRKITGDENIYYVRAYSI